MDPFAIANQQYFDNVPENYDDRPQSIELAKRIARIMRKSFYFDESSTIVMDFACGSGKVASLLGGISVRDLFQDSSGNLSRELAPYAKSIVGLDISPVMVERFNERTDNQGIPSDEMKAVCAHLKGEPGELDDVKFDVIVCALAYHHFGSIQDVTSMLAYFLKPGGKLLVVDLLKTDEALAAELFPEHESGIVAHRGGFRQEDVCQAFTAAGLENISAATGLTVKKKGVDVVLFLAMGERPQA